MGFRNLVSGLAVAAVLVASGSAALATDQASCPGNPNALGVGRIMVVSAGNYARLGLMQYRHSLPLNDREVVLTFDDGPLPPYTDRVLDILAYHCTRATFFMVGRQVAANPDTMRRVYDAGHTIGNHSQNHVIHFDRISQQRAEAEIENGNRTLAAILDRPNGIAPFFRVPGLERTGKVEKYAQLRSLVVWSADAVADDWTRITAQQVLNRALVRLEKRGKGILLLHDIQPRTVLMLPSLLAELKRRNFRIVHVVPEQGLGGPVPVAQLVAERAAAKLGWPRIASANGTAPVAMKFASGGGKTSDKSDDQSDGTAKKKTKAKKTRAKPESTSPTFETVGSILSDVPRQRHKRAKRAGRKHRRGHAEAEEPARAADAAPARFGLLSGRSDFTAIAVGNLRPVRARLDLASPLQQVRFSAKPHLPALKRNVSPCQVGKLSGFCGPS